MRAWFAKRFTRAHSYEVWGYAVWFGMGLVILVPALGAVLAPSIAVAVLVNRRFMLAYVLYGTIALFWVAIPSVLAYWFARDVPWPTLFATIANLQRRLHLVGLIVAIGLSVLAIHL